MPTKPPKTIKLDTPKTKPNPAPTPKKPPPAPGEQKQEEAVQTNTNQVLKTMEDQPAKTPNKSKPYKPILAAVVIILAGTVTGFGLSKAVGSGATLATKTSEEAKEQGIAVGDVIGSSDKDTFKDQAEGVLVAGGIEGEGSHHLLRPGGLSQNVYLTSSVLDLEPLIDSRLKVWGETFAAQKAGWLMDVGLVEVLELDAEKPFEEE